MSTQTTNLLELMGLRETLEAVLHDLEGEHIATARRRLREALAAPSPPLPLELGAARTIVKAARSLVKCTGPMLPDAPAATDTAYRVLYATLNAADHAVRLIEASHE
jgi:hypothetical protein